VHVESGEVVLDAVHDALEPRRLVGCVAEGIVAGARELERGPAVAVWAASLPDAAIETFHARVEMTEEGAAIGGVPDLDDGPSVVLLLVDPYSFPADAFLEALNAEHPGLPLVGGIAAGGGRPGAQALLVDGELHESGAVGAVVRGAPVVTVVSQGCTPIGRESVITAAEDNVVLELAGQPALDRLREDLEALPEEQRALAAQGILAGIVIDENRADYGRGDFLMRGLLGVDEGTDGLVIGAAVRVGQTVRFHVRDAASADEDLKAALDGVRGEGALLFTCNGRGEHMFGEPDHDARLVTERVGTTAVAGFFCGGEIGPVGGKAFLHGFTATLAVFT
jgi:small ligand-binding sensory domain FIST